ncbi:MAG TPA: outer membrane beta-barrel protein [Williamwhitmania sp.]|nr:outer membrane beta-barrel protein [Williamwhitmania sp.]
MWKYLVTSAMLLMLMTIGKLHAQNYAQNSRSTYFEVSLGAAIPSGDFAKTSGANAGFAKTGARVNIINYGTQFTPHWGLCATLFGDATPVDITAENTPMWAYAGLLVGPTATLPLGRLLRFDLKAMIGTSSTSSPVFQYGGITTDSKSASSTIYQIGAKVRFNPTSRFGIHLNADYVSLRPTFSGQTMKISSFDISFGLAYYFGRIEQMATSE